MALSWNIDTSENVEFDEFVAFFTAQGPRVLEHDLDASARMMRRLANNRRFLVERLNEELAALDNLKSFQSNNLYTPQVFLLHADPSFFVRVCVWEPLRKRPGETLFFYESAHDHNFSFMTVGYHGSGYRTEIAEYDPATLLGYVDEPVPMRFLEETTLPLGKVMFFRQSIDIHTQLPPEELSISINVLKRPGNERPDQYFFDMQRGLSKGKADKNPNAMLARLAGAVGDETTLGLLEEIAARNGCRRTRLAAYEVLAARRGQAAWQSARDDDDALVRHVAATALGVTTKVT
jgi:hypothetical protein